MRIKLREGCDGWNKNASSPSPEEEKGVLDRSNDEGGGGACCWKGRPDDGEGHCW